MSSIWDDAPMELFLSDEDFEAEFGRPRTPAQREGHEIFTDAALLAEPGTRIALGTEDDGGEAL